MSVEMLIIFIIVCLSVGLGIGLLYHWYDKRKFLKTAKADAKTSWKVEAGPLSTDRDTIRLQELVEFLDSDKYSAIYKEASDGDSAAQLELGKIFYDNANYDYEPMNKIVHKQSARWFIKASAQGSTEAKNYIVDIENNDIELKQEREEMDKEEKNKMKSIMDVVPTVDEDDGSDKRVGFTL